MEHHGRALLTPAVRSTRGSVLPHRLQGSGPMMGDFRVALRGLTAAYQPPSGEVTHALAEPGAQEAQSLVLGHKVYLCKPKFCKVHCHVDDCFVSKNTADGVVSRITPMEKCAQSVLQFLNLPVLFAFLYLEIMSTCASHLIVTCLVSRCCLTCTRKVGFFCEMTSANRFRIERHVWFDSKHMLMNRSTEAFGRFSHFPS